MVFLAISTDFIGKFKVGTAPSSNSFREPSEKEKTKHLEYITVQKNV